MVVSIYWNNELNQIGFSNIPFNTFGEFNNIFPSITQIKNLNNYNISSNLPWYNSNLNIFNSNSGFIGIGVSNPFQKLHLIGNFFIQGSIIPTIHSNFNLGSSNYKWKSLYLSSNSSYFSNLNISCSNLQLNDNYNNFIVFSLSNNQITLNSNGSIINTIDINNYSNIIYSNILNHTSNQLIKHLNYGISKRFNTDYINTGTFNKFISNNTYDSNILFTSNLNVLSNLYINNYKIPLELSNSKFFYNETFYNSNIFDLINEDDFTINHKLSSLYSLLNLNSNYLLDYSLKSNINWFDNSNTNSGSVGINNPNPNPSYKLDIIGDLNFNSNLFLNNQLIPFNIYSNTNIISSNSIVSSNCFIYYTNGSITFPQTTLCDILVVGAGGYGGIGPYSGGGGAGEVIAYPNYSFPSGTYDINVGLSSSNSNIRISKITSNSFSIFANGGGNGAYSNVNPEKGGSGGGGYSNLINGATKGIVFNISYSYMNNGTNGTVNNGGNGGSSLYTSTITGTSLTVGLAGIGATATSIPLLKESYGSGGDGNGGIGTTGIIIFKIPFNINKSYFNGYIEYSNIINKPIINQLVANSNLIDIGFNNQINFNNGNVAWNNQWFIYTDSNNNNLTFWNSNTNSKWFFNGSITNNNNEISDSRIKKEITDISNPIQKLISLNPKEYFLCDDCDYFKKYGLIAQNINSNSDLKYLVYNDSDFIANIYSNGFYIGNIITSDITIIDKINIGDEIKFIISKNIIHNSEMIIDDLLYHNRYKKRYSKVKKIINDYSFEIFDFFQNFQEKQLIFIYGKKVSDFNKLDYSSLYTLNIACNQELFKLIQSNSQKIKTLNSRLNEL